METSNMRLKKIKSELMMIVMESQNYKNNTPKKMETKLQNYAQGNILIEESLNLITQMEQEIKNLNTSKIDKSQISKINEYIDILQNKNPKFDETLYIVEQLQMISNGFPLSNEIHDNIDGEVIYEEQEIDTIN
jgi:hypothetical protein